MTSHFEPNSADTPDNSEQSAALSSNSNNEVRPIPTLAPSSAVPPFANPAFRRRHSYPESPLRSNPPPRLPPSQYPYFSMLAMPEADIHTPTKPPLLKSLRGRQAIFVAWLNNAPLVKSFIEEEERGNAKMTRSNTLANRRNTPAYSDTTANLIQQPLLAKQVSTSTSASRDSPSSSTLTSMSDMDQPRRNISFAKEVHVYADVKAAVPVVKKVRSHPDGSPRVRTRRPTGHAVDQYTPTSTAGKWLLRKTSSGDLPDLE